MRIALVSPYSFLRPGGVQEHVRGLARALVGLGHEVTVFAPELRGPDAVPPGVIGISLGGAVNVPANGSVAPLGLDPRMLVRFDLGLDPADVVHVHEPLLPASAGAVLRSPKPTGVVGTFHAAADRSVPYAIGRLLARPVVRRLGATTAVSPAAAKLARKYLKVDPSIVHNGVDAEAFAKAEPDPWMRSLGRTVLFVGRPEKRKGFDTALAAFMTEGARRDDVHFVCVPAGPDTFGPLPGRLRGRVHGLGPVPRQRLLSLFRAADVLLVPSTGGESFGLVVVEGLAAGAAVLAGDIPGYRYAAGDAAVYATPGELGEWRALLARALDDEEWRADLAARGPGRAARYDWPVVARQTLAVYEKLAR